MARRIRDRASIHLDRVFQTRHARRGAGFRSLGDPRADTTPHGRTVIISGGLAEFARKGKWVAGPAFTHVWHRRATERDMLAGEHWSRHPIS
jgi:hypothetical protein